MNLDLTIVVPTFREKDNLKVLIPAIENSFKGKDVNFQILVVDDDSGDGTVELIKYMDSKYFNVKILVRKNKKDIASAWHDGFNLSKSRFIACMDGDMSHHPKYLVTMYDEILKNNSDLVIGSRYLGGFYTDFQGKKFFPRFISAIGQYLGRFILGLKQRDISHSFRVFKQEVFEKNRDCLTSKGNSYLVEFLYLTIKNKFSVTEVPIIYQKRAYGKTKLKLLREGIRYFYGLFLIRWKNR